MQLNPYLMFDGQCKAAFEFYAKCLGGEIVAMMTYGETPAAEHSPPEMKDKIIHARMLVGDDLLMASDTPKDQYEAMKGVSITLGFDDPTEAERVFHALSDGGNVQMPFQETFWALGFGMLVDKFGTPWMINCDKPSEEEAA